MLIVANQAAFTTRYGAGLPVAGHYVGALANEGERITLLDASNEEILDFTYDNKWYPITDGAGFSLVVQDEQAEPDLWDFSSNWRPSGVENGAPGQPDAPPPSCSPVTINDMHTFGVHNPDRSSRGNDCTG